MKKIIKKQLPTRLAEKLANARKEEVFNVYYLVDDEIYIHTEFYVDEENPPLTLVHDMAYLESEMIKYMQGQDKMYIDEAKNAFYDLYYLALWFYDRIPSKDWQDLLNFLRLIEEHEGMNNFIKFPSEEPVIN
jgi:hypothetical protein